jgi:hypothetical protein
VISRATVAREVGPVRLPTRANVGSVRSEFPPVGSATGTVAVMPDPQAPSGTGQKSGMIELKLEPDTDALGQSTQLLEIDLTGVKLADFHSSLGSTEFLSNSKLTMSIINQSHDLQGTAHIDLIKQSWPDIGHNIKMSTAIGNELVYTSPEGATGTVGLTYDVEFGPDSKLEIQITTDMTTGQTTGTVGFKYTF